MIETCIEQKNVRLIKRYVPESLDSPAQQKGIPGCKQPRLSAWLTE